jgi:CubicO group peptidase (beta-lactamase class C family)
MTLNPSLMKPVRALLWCVLLTLNFISISDSLGQDQTEDTAQRVLRSSIQRVMIESEIPGAGIAIVTKDGPVWVSGLGKANIEDNVAADEHTLFRIASISKMFVALSILKLQAQGKLNLNDAVRDHAPDVVFENRWEGTDPVRIVHLLEHTTGWDDYHLTEQVRTPITLKQGLDFHPHSRRCRWVPGSRMAYSNSGSAVAAYIVEKVTGQVYEDYVHENFFAPLGMTNTTFFNDARHQQWGATLYDADLRPLPYRHVIQRPAGAIHSSAAEMAGFVRFLLNRGAVDSLQLISSDAISRMEVSKSTPAAKAGLRLGYGLANFTSIHNGFLFQGHSGGMPGAISELAYLPERGIGHVLFMNCMNTFAFSQISALIRDYETRDVTVDSLDQAPRYTGNLTFPDGYYIPINPRSQGGYYFDRLFDVFEFKAIDGYVQKSWILPGGKEIFYPVTDSAFRKGDSRWISLVRTMDPLEGEVLHTDSRVYARIPSIVVFGQLTVLVIWMLMMGFGGLIWIVALIQYWTGTRSPALRISGYPTLASVLFLATAVLLFSSLHHHSDLLAEPGALSVTLMAMSVWFALSAGWAMAIILNSRMQKTAGLTFWLMAVLSGLHVLVAGYLIWFDVIPVVTWA